MLIVSFVNVTRLLQSGNGSEQDIAMWDETARKIRLVFGQKMQEAIMAESAQFFRNIADFIEAFPPSKADPGFAYFPVVSPAHFSAIQFFAQPITSRAKS